MMEARPTRRTERQLFGMPLSRSLPIAPGLFFLAVFLVVPLALMIFRSLTDPATGSMSLSGIETLFGVAGYRRVLGNTLSVGIACAILSVALGYPVANWLASLDERHRRRALFLVMAPFWTSVLVRSFAWLVLLGRHGPVATFLNFFGLPGGDALLFNRITVVATMVHVLLPMAIISMLPTHLAINRQLLSAARTLGGGNADIFWRIYMPLSLRGCAASGLLIFLMALGFFITPMLLGGLHDVLLGELIILQIDHLQNWHFGGALALVIVIIGGLAILLANGLFDLSGARATLPPRPSSIAFCDRTAQLFTRLGRAVPALVPGPATIARASSIYSWFVIVSLTVPLLAIIPMAFTRDVFLTFPPRLGTFHWFALYFHDPQWVAATLASFRIGAGAAILSVLLAGSAAYAVARADGRIVGMVILLFMIPLAVPPIVIALALFGLFAKMSLLATDLAIILGHTVICIPVVFTILLAGFRSYDWRLNQAAATLGARTGAIVGRVAFPLLRSVVISALIAGFLTSFDELTVALFLGGGLKTTLPKQMWDAILLEASPLLAAVSVTMMIVVVVLFLVMEATQKNRISPERELTLPH
jgi:putative spermidine/putrescine transport system permease protein